MILFAQCLQLQFIEQKAHRNYELLAGIIKCQTNLSVYLFLRTDLNYL